MNFCSGGPIPSGGWVAAPNSRPLRAQLFTPPVDHRPSRHHARSTDIAWCCLLLGRPDAAMVQRVGSGARREVEAARRLRRPPAAWLRRCADSCPAARPAPRPVTAQTRLHPVQRGYGLRSRSLRSGTHEEAPFGQSAADILPTNSRSSSPSRSLTAQNSRPCSDQCRTL
jgi:hypothetical protein